MIAVRALTDTELKAFRLARLVSAETMPYFMHVLCAVTPLAAPGLGTFAVDAYWRLYMDPDLLVGPQAWSPRTAGAVLLHEVGHLIRQHAERALAVCPQPLSPDAWNYACDAEINDDLLEAGVALPDGVITPQALGCEPGGLAETYYEAIRPRDGQPLEIDFGDESGCGSGAGLPVQGWELPRSADGGLDRAEADLVRRNVAVAVRQSRAAGRGTTPSGLARWADATLAPPQVPWYELLRTVLRRVVANKAGDVASTFSRLSRRRVPGVILAGRRSPKVRVTLVVDTSGSMGESDLNAALSEISSVLTTTGVDRDQVRVLACDAASTTPQQVRSVDDIHLVGGGGTDMRVGIAAAESVHPAPHVVVVLTDGETPWPDQPTRAALVCVIIGRARADAPPWAQTVFVPTGARTSTTGVC